MDVDPVVFDTIDFRSIPLLSRRVGQRYGFSAVALSRTQVALLGGSVHFEFSSSAAPNKGDVERGNPVPFSQVHCIDREFGCSLLSLSSAKELPCPRLYHSATKVGPDVIVFGGQAFNDKRKLADIWVLHIGDNDSTGSSWSELPPASRSTAFPPPRSKHAVTTLPSGALVVSGGSGFEDSLLGDMWLATIESGSYVSWKKITTIGTSRVPVARKQHALSPMISDVEFLMHGGVDVNGAQLRDLWIAKLVGGEKCAWTELVSAPSPRSCGHLMIPIHSEKKILVFGGNHPSAMNYSLDKGEWSLCPFQEGVGHSFVAAELDVFYKLDESEVPIPSVLLVPDTVLRSNPSNPWIASIFPINPRDEEDVDTELKKEEVGHRSEITLVNSVDSETTNALRKSAYRSLSHQLPSIPPPTHFDEIPGPLMNTDPSVTGGFVPQSPLFTVDYLVTGLVASDAQVSLSSWSGHVLGTGDVSSVDSLESLKSFINTEESIRTITECANSCVVVVNAANGEKLFAFISEALNRHSLCGKFVSPVVSVSKTSYAQVQAALRLVMTYTPFRSPAALDQLFALFNNCGSGFLLIDFDGESDNKSPLLSHFKPTILKDSVSFWTDVLESIPRSPRVRIGQYALTFLDSTDVAVNGHFPSMSLIEAAKKGKLLDKAKEIDLGRFGVMTIGKLRGSSGSQAGILLYSEGVLVRHIKGRFPFEPLEGVEDELEGALNTVTGFVELGSVFSPIHGALSDLHEAVSKSADWTQFITSVQEACFAYKN